VNGWTTGQAKQVMYKYNLSFKKKEKEKKVMYNLDLSFQFFSICTEGQQDKQVKELGELGQVSALLR
jgi:hypothetical protein